MGWIKRYMELKKLYSDKKAVKMIIEERENVNSKRRSKKQIQESITKRN